MDATLARPDPTPRLDGRVPRPAPVRLRLLARFGVVGLVLTAADLAVRVRRLRDRGARVPALRHDVDLPGRFPPRWVVVLGDSAAAGHGLPAPEVALPRLLGEGLRTLDGRATAVRSVAEDGACTEDVTTRQIAAIAGADVVVIGVGVNDAIRPWRTADEVAAATEALLQRVQRTVPDAGVVLLTCPDLSAAPGLPALLRPALGWRCRRVAAVQTAVADRVGVPTVHATRREVTATMLGQDGFHPGVEAHRLLADRVLEVLALPGAVTTRR
jgi:lysophospholipase L1-like esterase